MRADRPTATRFGVRYCLARMRAVIPVDCFLDSGQWSPQRYYVAHHATSGALYRYSAPAIPTSTSSTMSGLGVWTAGGVWQMPFVGGYT